MEITRNVILDLLPLYLADEVSADTRTLVEKFLQTDPDVAKLAERLAAIELPDDFAVPLTREDKMEAFREAKRLMFRRTVILAVLISFILAILGMALLAAIFVTVR